MKVSFVIALGLLLVGVRSAGANTVTFDSNSVTGQNFSGEAVFTLSANSLDIKLTNLTVNTHDAGDLLRSVSFVLSNPSPSSLSISSINGSMIDVNGNQTYNSDSSTPSWSLSSSPSGVHAAAGPSDLIIGAPTGATYSNANSSITNGTHSPFTFETMEFVISAPGLQPNSTISSVIFGYGTSSCTVDSTRVPNLVTAPLPAPVYAGLALFGMMGLMLKLGRRNSAC